MQRNFPVNILFPTSFSDACFKTIPALSEWMDDPDTQLTILHVYDAKKSKKAQVEQKLHSFFAEADQYGRCERMLIHGNPETVILEQSLRNSYDLIFAPASEPTGFPRFGHNSLRVNLIKNGSTPVWTSEDLMYGMSMRRRPQSVAYVMTSESNWQEQLITAAHTAARWNATFNLIYLFAAPSIHDGTLASDLFIEDPHGPLAELRFLGSRLPVPVHVRTTTGNDQIEIPRLISECNADLIFMSYDQAISNSLVGTSINPVLRKIHGQFICFPKDFGSVRNQEYIRLVNEWELLRSN